jgi:hypothetical protein
MFAARYNTPDVVTYLLKAGAKTDDRDAVGWTALNWALVGGKFDNAALLEKAGTKLAVLAKDQGTPPELVVVKPDETLNRKTEVDSWAAALSASNGGVAEDKLDRILEEVRLLKLQVAELEGRLVVSSPISVHPAEVLPTTATPAPIIQLVEERRPFPAFLRVRTSASAVATLANDTLPDRVILEQLTDLWFEPKENHLAQGWKFQGIQLGVGMEEMKLHLSDSQVSNGWYGWTETRPDKSVYWPYAHLGLEIGSWLSNQLSQSLDGSIGLAAWVFRTDGGYTVRYSWSSDFALWGRAGLTWQYINPQETQGTQVFGASISLGFQLL